MSNNTEKYCVYSMVDRPENAGEEVISVQIIDGIRILVVKLKIYEAKPNATTPSQQNSTTQR